MNAKELLKETTLSTIYYPNKLHPERIVLDKELFNQALTAMDETCVWEQDDDGNWHTSCKDLDKPVKLIKNFTRIFGFCPKCGCEIEEAKP